MHSFGTLMRFIWRSGKRAAVFVVGVALLTVGLIMFVTPGPGIVLVVAGLAVLATEFAWAEHLLDKAKKQAARAGQSAQRLPGVAKAAAAAGRLVPRRWRRATVTSVLDADQPTASSEPPAAGPQTAGPPAAGEPDAEPQTAEPQTAEPQTAEAPEAGAQTAGAPDAARGIGQRHTSGQRRARRHRDHEPR